MRNRNHTTRHPGSHLWGPSSKLNTAQELAKGLRGDQTAFRIAARSLSKLRLARREASMPCSAPGINRPNNPKPLMKIQREHTDQPRKMVSRWPPRSLTSSSTDHFSSSWDNTYSRISLRTTLDVLIMWEIGDSRNRNSAVNRRSVYMDRGTTGLGV